MATPRQDDLLRLAKLVKDRRLHLDQGRQKAAAEAGMSKDTWRRVEDGKPVRETTYKKIDKVLQWAEGSCRTVLRGGAPVEIEHAQSAEGFVFTRLTPEDLKDAVEGAVQDAMVALTDAPAPQIREAKARVIAELRRRGIFPDTDGN